MHRYRLVDPGSTGTRRSAARRLLMVLSASVALVIGQMTVTISPASAGQVGVTISIQGSGSVSVVEGSIEDGATGLCNWTSNKDERVTNVCSRFRNEELLEAWVWLRPSPSSVPTGHWRFDSWSGCDETRVRDGYTECAVHSGAANNVERTPKAHFVDDFAPTVSAVTETFSTVEEKRVTYSFSTNEGQTECRSDSETAFTTCQSGVVKNYTTEGSHTFEVRAVDASGQISGSSSRTITVLDTALTGGPPQAGLVNSNNPTFTYSSGAGTGFMCSIDTVFTYTPCNSGSKTYTGLAEGTHTFRVYSTNGGWWDRIPAVRTWTIDTTPPDTSLTGASTSGQTADFSFAGTGNSFECQLAGPGLIATWAACTSPKSYTALADGAYTFSTRSKDTAGNVDPSAVTHSWTIDTTAPNTTVLNGPAHDSFALSTSATFGFGATETASSFTCTLDAAPIACGTSLPLTGLSHTTHTVTAAATDTHGNTDPSPAQRTWTVPLDSTELTHGTGWTKRTSTATYLNTYSQAKAKGSKLTRSVTGARKVALIATKAPGHGKVRVYAGTQLLKTVDLRAATLRTKQLIPITSFATPFTGNMRVVVYTAGKVVRVEGLGVAH